MKINDLIPKKKLNGSIEDTLLAKDVTLISAGFGRCYVSVPLARGGTVEYTHEFYIQNKQEILKRAGEVT